MNQDLKVKREQFWNWYQSQPKNQLRAIRKAICQSCGISNNVFYNWLAGISPIPVSAQIVINKAAGKDIFEVPETISVEKIISANNA